MEQPVGTAMAWGMLTLLALLPIWFLWYAWDSRRARRSGRPQTVRRMSSGAVMGIDAVFQPTASDATRVWEVQHELPAPAPTPGDGPGVIRDGRIVIGIPSRDTGARGTQSRGIHSQE